MSSNNKPYWLFVFTLWMIDHIYREKAGILYDILVCFITNGLFYYSLDDGNILLLINKSYLVPFGIFAHYKFYHLIHAGYEESSLMFVAGFTTALWLLYVPQIITMSRYYIAGKDLMKEVNNDSPIDFFMNMLNGQKKNSNESAPNQDSGPAENLLNLFSTMASSIAQPDRKEKSSRKKNDERTTTVEFKSKNDQSSKDLKNIMDMMEDLVDSDDEEGTEELVD